MYHSIEQVFENEMGNRYAPELMAGMVCSLIDILAAGVEQSAATETIEIAVQTLEEQHHVLMEVGNGLA
ncbi:MULTISPECIES: hypothetical protein [Alcaligenes]|uniref:hypothetical protein n=1 Tax=Alcaligenes TaxID=507 RepID=UPI0002AA8C14|nr:MULTISPECIES: hypothetical protein [Alcaligenes]EKU29555.1 hypothetical protein C660_13584 [Alcaligenes sp. HPC1271]ERI34895.1 hypothetical protein N879_05055 [Alcaligenes sp. EGD-AK7]HRO20673.1 hypothetical protein [Alcaligenes phenolicus]HRP13505.1 hypothetical protein [Alcaligenes phenolicus]